MVVYKVVDGHHGMYTSYAAWCMADDVWVEYKLGEVTHPSIPGSRLFAFDTLANAIRYSVEHGRRPILVCRCGDARPFQGLIPRVPFAARAWVDGSVIVPEGCIGLSVPAGTILVDWLKPLNLVNDLREVGSGNSI